MKMTSAQANKFIKQFEDELDLLREKERTAVTYKVIGDEEPIIPDYNYVETAKEKDRLNEKITKIRHAINVNNTNNKIDVNGTMMSIDTILIKMAQLTRRKNLLDWLRKFEPKKRIRHYDTLGESEYEYINYELKDVKADYKKVFNELTQMQLALDHYNHTVEFEVDIELTDLEVDM